MLSSVRYNKEECFQLLNSTGRVSLMVSMEDVNNTLLIPPGGIALQGNTTGNKRINQLTM